MNDRMKQHEELKLTPEEFEAIANIIRSILDVVDALLSDADIEVMTQALKSMENATAVVRDSPLPKASKKAREMMAMIKVFRAIISLFKSRGRCLEELKKEQFSGGDKLLKDLGFDTQVRWWMS